MAILIFLSNLILHFPALFPLDRKFIQRYNNKVIVKPFACLLFLKRGCFMNKKVRWITETAVMLALLVSLQALTKPLGQLVTGSCVNAVLAISALVGGVSCGITVAVISPVLAFLLGIAPQILTVPAIMAGNALYVLVLHFILRKHYNQILRQAIGWISAAAVKFAALYVIVAKLICGVLAEGLLASGMLKEPMLKALPATFSWPQLFTALIGGAVALLIAPVLRKALRK
jgi:hypothetical protein